MPKLKFKGSSSRRLSHIDLLKDSKNVTEKFLKKKLEFFGVSFLTIAKLKIKQNNIPGLFFVFVDKIVEKDVLLYNQKNIWRHFSNNLICSYDSDKISDKDGAAFFKIKFSLGIFLNMQDYLNIRNTYYLVFFFYWIEHMSTKLLFWLNKLRKGSLLQFVNKPGFEEVFFIDDRTKNMNLQSSFFQFLIEDTESKEEYSSLLSGVVLPKVNNKLIDDFYAHPLDMKKYFNTNYFGFTPTLYDVHFVNDLPQETFFNIYPNNLQYITNFSLRYNSIFVNNGYMQLHLKTEFLDSDSFFFLISTGILPYNHFTDPFGNISLTGQIYNNNFAVTSSLQNYYFFNKFSKKQDYVKSDKRVIFFKYNFFSKSFKSLHFVATLLLFFVFIFSLYIFF